LLKIIPETKLNSRERNEARGFAQKIGKQSNSIQISREKTRNFTNEFNRFVSIRVFSRLIFVFVQSGFAQKLLKSWKNAEACTK
jgi:hypothetical protein